MRLFVELRVGGIASLLGVDHGERDVSIHVLRLLSDFGLRLGDGRVGRFGSEERRGTRRGEGESNDSAFHVFSP